MGTSTWNGSRGQHRCLHSGMADSDTHRLHIRSWHPDILEHTAKKGETEKDTECWVVSENRTEGQARSGMLLWPCPLHLSSYRFPCTKHITLCLSSYAGPISSLAVFTYFSSSWKHNFTGKRRTKFSEGYFPYDSCYSLCPDVLQNLMESQVGLFQGWLNLECVILRLRVCGY